MAACARVRRGGGGRQCSHKGFSMTAASLTLLVSTCAANRLRSAAVRPPSDDPAMLAASRPRRSEARACHCRCRQEARTARALSPRLVSHGDKWKGLPCAISPARRAGSCLSGGPGANTPRRTAAPVVWTPPPADVAIFVLAPAGPRATASYANASRVCMHACLCTRGQPYPNCLLMAPGARGSYCYPPRKLIRPQLGDAARAWAGRRRQ